MTLIDKTAWLWYKNNKYGAKFMKRIILVIISAVMLISVTFSVSAFAEESGQSGFQIRIVHTNDIHARVVENAKSGIIGVERLKSIIDDYTAGADIGLVLDSGDLFHGQPIATLVKGESIAELVKSCGYDAMTAGNHDWSYGKDRLKELVKAADLKMLTGNVVDSDNNRFFDDEYYIKEVTKDGKTLKVGIFGVIDPKIYTSTAPSNVSGLKFTDSAAYAKKAAAELEKQGCDIVIALSHTNSPTEFAKQVDGVDLWLCGHEHIDIDTTVTTPSGDTAYVIEDGYYLYQAGSIQLDCTLNGDGEIKDLSCKRDVCNYDSAAQYEKNAEVCAVLDEINARQSEVLCKVVGKSPAELDGVWEHLRIGETNLGKAVASAYLLETGADVAFENAGGIRASVKSGDVTYGDIIGVSPYGNYIVTKQISGGELLEILETSIDIQLKCIAANDSGDYDAWPQSSGSYLQSAGLNVQYNPSLESGKRVISVMINGESLDKNKLYTVAMNNFLAQSYYYPQLANAAEVGEYSACDEALVKYFMQSADTIAADIAKVGMTVTDKTEEEAPETTASMQIQPTTAATSALTSVAETSTAAVTETHSDMADKSPQTGAGGAMPLCFAVIMIAAAAVVKLKKAA